MGCPDNQMVAVEHLAQARPRSCAQTNGFILTVWVPVTKWVNLKHDAQ